MSEKIGISQFKPGFDLNFGLFKKISSKTKLNLGARLEFSKLNLSSNAKDSVFDFKNISIPLNFTYKPLKAVEIGFIIGNGLTLSKVRNLSPILEKRTTNINYYISGGCFYDIKFNSFLFRPVIIYERNLSHAIKSLAAFTEVYRIGLIII